MRVRAAGVNPVDAKIRAGYLAGAFPSAFPLVPGWDVAGVVESTGPAVTEFAWGTEVVGYVRKDHIQHGTYAELVAAPIRAVAPKPSSASFVEAAGLPLTGLTAHQALDAAAVGPGDTVLVHAAAGGVGTMAVQLARLRGAHVVGTASEANHEFLRGLGAEPVTYGAGLITRVGKAAPAGVDAVIDLIGGEALELSFALVADPARVVSIVDAHDGARQRGALCVRPSRSGHARRAVPAGRRGESAGDRRRDVPARTRRGGARPGGGRPRPRQDRPRGG